MADGAPIRISVLHIAQTVTCLSVGIAPGARNFLIYFSR